MKKTFFLSKGIEKFSNLEINDLAPIKGGATIIEEKYITLLVVEVKDVQMEWFGVID